MPYDGTLLQPQASCQDSRTLCGVPRTVLRHVQRGVVDGTRPAQPPNHNGRVHTAALQALSQLQQRGPEGADPSTGTPRARHGPFRRHGGVPPRHVCDLPPDFCWTRRKVFGYAYFIRLPHLRHLHCPRHGAPVRPNAAAGPAGSGLPRGQTCRGDGARGRSGKYGVRDPTHAVAVDSHQRGSRTAESSRPRWRQGQLQLPPR